MKGVQWSPRPHRNDPRCIHHSNIWRGFWNFNSTFSLVRIIHRKSNQACFVRFAKPSAVASFLFFFSFPNIAALRRERQFPAAGLWNVVEHTNSHALRWFWLTALFLLNFLCRRCCRQLLSDRIPDFVLWIESVRFSCFQTVNLPSKFTAVRDFI